MRKVKKVLFTMMMLFILCISSVIIMQLKEEKPLSIIFIPKVVETNNDFWNLVVEGAYEAQEEYDIELQIMAASKEGSYEKQNQIILEAIQKQPDAIILAAEDYEKTAIEAQKIKDHGIKLVIIDAGIKGKIENIIVATNNFEAGIKMGYRVKKLLSKEGSAVVISHSKGTLTAIEREKGIRAALSDMEEQVVASYSCDSDADKAYKSTIEAIETYDNLEVIAALNQYASIGAARAIKDLGLIGKIKIIGFDNSKEQIKYLEEGIYDSLIIQNPFAMGYLSVQETVKLLKGEKVQVNVNTGSTVITKENMYIGMNQRLLFPF